MSSTAGPEEKFDHLQMWFTNKLSLRHVNQDLSNKPTVLDQMNLDGVANYIKAGKCNKIITMAGAGISTSAGIPDLRSPSCGLYSQLHGLFNLPYPEAIFELEYFKKNPEPFFVLTKELCHTSFKPTLCHYFIKLLNKKGLLLRHYTQNVDALEHVAGIPGDKIVEAHGTVNTSHCINPKCEKKLQS